MNTRAKHTARLLGFGLIGAVLITTITLAEFSALAASWSEVAPAHPLVFGIQEKHGLDGGAVALIATLAAVAIFAIAAITTDDQASCLDR